MIAKRHLLYLAGRIVPTGIGFVGMIVYSHLLDASVYGEFALILSWAIVLSGGLLSWIRIALLRFVATADDRADRMTGVALALQVALSAVALITLAALAFVQDDPKIIVIGILAVTLGWSDLCLDLLRAHHNALGYSFLYLARQLITVGGSLAAIALHAALNPIALGYVAGGALSSLLVIGAVLPRPAFRFNRSDLAIFVRHGLPLSVNFGLAGFANTIDKLLVIWLMGPALGGVYALASDLVRQLIATIMDGVSLAALPDAAKAMQVGGRKAAGGILMQNLTILMFIGTPAAFGLAACGPAVASTFLGGPFQAAAMMLIPALAVGGLARGVRTFFLDVAFQVADRTVLSAGISLISILALSGICAAFIPPWGILGAAVGAAFGLFIALFIGGIIANRIFRFHLPFADLAKILAGSTCAAAITLVAGGQSTSHLGLTNAVICGALAYAAIITATNALDLRSEIWRLIRQR